MGVEVMGCDGSTEQKQTWFPELLEKSRLPTPLRTPNARSALCLFLSTEAAFGQERSRRWE